MHGNRKTLEAYATRYGSTIGIAEAVAAALREEGLEADVRPGKEIDDLSGYGTVILGAPIFAGRWMGDAFDFLERHYEVLKTLPVAYFTVGVLPVAKQDEGDVAHARVMEKARQTLPDIVPVEIGMFAGAVDKSKMGFFIRLMMTLGRAKEGDFRDWEAIQVWGKAVANKLLVTDKEVR